MTILCSAKDFYIIDKLRSGEWIPSLDTGEVYSTTKKGFLTFGTVKNGYRVNGGVQLSHVIWIAANGAIPYGMSIDHINGNKQDNRLCNLQLISQSENTHLGLARLTYMQAEEIRRRYAEGGISQKKLAEEYRVNKHVISDIVKNKTYKNPVHTDFVSEETRKKILDAYKNGRSINTIRNYLGLQMAVVRQILEEELSKEAKEADIQEIQS